jgi:hypothetical protein
MLDITTSMRVMTDPGCKKNDPCTTPACCGGRRCRYGVPVFDSSRLVVFGCFDVRCYLEMKNVFELGWSDIGRTDRR